MIGDNLSSPNAGPFGASRARDPPRPEPVMDVRLARRARCDIRYGGYRPVPDGTKPGSRPA